MTFQIHQKRYGLKFASETVDGQRIAMCGPRFQGDFTHGIPVSFGGYRMSVTARLCTNLKMCGEYKFGDMALPMRWMKGPYDPNPDHVWDFVKKSCCRDAIAFMEQEWEASEPPWKRRRQ